MDEFKLIFVGIISALFLLFALSAILNISTLNKIDDAQRIQGGLIKNLMLVINHMSEVADLNTGNIAKNTERAINNTRDIMLLVQLATGTQRNLTASTINNTIDRTNDNFVKLNEINNGTIIIEKRIFDLDQLIQRLTVDVKATLQAIRNITTIGNK